MRFGHAEAEKVSFVDAVATTQLANIEWGCAMLLKMLCHWLEWLVPTQEGPQVAAVRAQQRHTAEGVPWLYPPPY